ncbi:MAG: DUF72 domain-containing protein [Bacteroidota bacterium]
MPVGDIHIGTSGWSYKGWRGPFYPQKLRAADWLNFYAGQFTTTEINASFYRLPTIETVTKWAAHTPAHFLFCPKMSRYLTHMKKLLDPEEPLERFFAVFDNIKDRLGPVLIQLPAQVRYNEGKIEHFFKVLKKVYRDHEFVLEFRHDTWLEKGALAMLSEYDVGAVISQSGVGWPYTEMVTAKNIYVRFHGPGKLYASSYSDDMLKGFAKKFRKWVKQGHTVWAYFNNDVHAYAVKDAARLKAFCGQE